ncbi:hypothetical protein IV203_034730 [Nitzschia inconspicua]|uniref:Uncharacterized protein n=1 Tax=Nitzschia inconspicua TaxID=303405 RepID=A0A9K3LCP4_9STRA|nr:hypothetical protein IV203_034730 [Nitzschia inconspicua]
MTTKSVVRSIVGLFLLEVLALNLSRSVQGAILGRSQKSANENQRSFHFHNKSGRRVDVLWVNVHKTPNEFVSQNGGEGYPFGGDTSVLSYIGHEFEILEMPSKKTKKCLFEECRKARFTVNDQENQEIVINDSFKVIHKDNRQRAYATASNLFEECQREINDKNMNPMEALEAMSECMETKVNESLAKVEEERTFQSALRRQMTQNLVPYACGDVNFTESREVSNLTWTYRVPTTGERQEHTLNVLHQRPTSEIFKIDNFTKPKFCDAIHIYEEDGKVPMTAMSEGTAQGSMLFQLGIKMYALAREKLWWDEMEFAHMHKQGIPLFQVFRDEKGLDLPALKCIGDIATATANAAKGRCRLAGAPPLAAETKPFVVEEGSSQLAQFFLFCDKPKSLGGLHFPQAGVHVAPQAGRLVMAVNRFRDGEMDDFVKEYHLCPNYNTYVHTFVEPRDDKSKQSS